MAGTFRAGCPARRICVSYTLTGACKLMHRLGFSALMPRPKHPGSSDEERGEFKKNTLPQAYSTVRDSATRKRVFPIAEEVDDAVAGSDKRRQRHALTLRRRMDYTNRSKLKETGAIPGVKWKPRNVGDNQAAVCLILSKRRQFTSSPLTSSPRRGTPGGRPIPPPARGGSRPAPRGGPCG
ncbi:MAG: winged helix-turn-helix domain-containing protein [Planctomycetota bacterium]|nr:winged helix-turn-helix domain-containing protein [Planctomycetota bacterium]